jgi:hypothetical protein
MENLPLVSTTPAANFGTSFASVVDTFCPGVYDTGCKLKVNLKAKIYLKVDSTSQRCLNNIIKTFMIEDLFHLHLELQISSQIFEKICNRPNGILRGLGETDS